MKKQLIGLILVAAFAASPALAGLYTWFPYQDSGGSPTINDLGPVGVGVYTGTVNIAYNPTFITDTPSGSGYAMDLPSGPGAFDWTYHGFSDGSASVNLNSAGQQITIATYLKFHGWPTQPNYQVGLLTHLQANMNPPGWSFGLWNNDYSGNWAGSPYLFFFMQAEGGGAFWRVSNTVLPTNEWVHVAMTWTAGSGNPVFYVNGVDGGSVGDDLSGRVSIYWSEGSRLGVKDWSYWGLNGAVDDVRLYDEVRTQAQIQALMVPEPASSLLLVGTGLAFWLRRRLARR